MSSTPLAMETPKPSPVDGIFIPIQTEEAQRKGSKVAIVGTGAGASS